MDFDLQKFYRERDERMQIPDEDLNEYRQRMLMHNTQTRSQTGCASSYPESEEPVTQITKQYPSFTSLATTHLGNSTASPYHTDLLATGAQDSNRALASLSSSHAQQPTSSHLHLDGNGQKQLRNHQESFSSGQPVDNVHVNLKNNEEINSTPRVANSAKKNAEEMRVSRNASIYETVKRKEPPIQKSPPAKRQKSAEDAPLWDNSSVYATSTPFPQIESRNVIEEQLKSQEEATGAVVEQPSEIKSFTPSPRRSPHTQQYNSVQNSPISDFSTFLTHPPSPKARQRIKNPGSGLRIEIGQPNNRLLGLRGGIAVHAARQDQHEDTSNPSTSPIEDLSAQDIQISLPEEDSIPRKTIVPAGSSLYLEVKERVARHTAMKHRDKVIPIGSKETEIDVIADGKKKQESRHETMTESRMANSSRSTPVNPKERQPEKVKNARISKPPVKQTRKPQPSKKEKGKEKKESPQEYAQLLLDKAQTNPKRKSSVIQFLEGTRIFYTGGDMQCAGDRTRARMEMILKYGGELVPTFNPDIVTHIVTDASKKATLRALGYKRLNEIPDHIPTVKWNWILAAYVRTGRFDKEEIQAKMEAEDLWINAAFSERMDVTGHRNRSSLEVSRKDEKKISNVDDTLSGPSTSHGDLLTTAPGSSHNQAPSSFRGSLPSPPTSSVKQVGKSRAISLQTGSSTASVKNDPLAEFYAAAKVARDLSWSRHNECDETDDEIEEMSENSPPPPLPTRKRGWTCDKKDPQQTTCVNQDIIDRLQELQELHKAKLGDEDHWRAFSYNKSIRAIRAYQKRIKSFSEARSIRGVGEKTALKIMEILQTGDLQRIKYERTNDVEVTRLFQGIYGVGQMTAFKWYSSGCRTLDDLWNGKGGVRLNPAQLIGLQYYDDINNRMPRNEAKAIFDLIKPIALSLDSKLFVEIMGSYRRGKADCGDIDILITRPTDDECTHAGIIGRLLPALRAANILTDDLAVPEDVNDLECVYRGLCHLPNQKDSRRRRIDFLTVPWKNRGGALLYYTGDDIFNRAMRLKANKMGYSLNQRGLSSGIVRDPKDFRVKLNEGTIIASETEEEIFQILNVPWQEPEERVRG